MYILFRYNKHNIYIFTSKKGHTAMNYGYIRVSSKGQNLDRQIEALKAYDLDRIFQEKISGKDMNRPQLQKMLKTLKEGDKVYVEELSRLARSMQDLCTITEEIIGKGAFLVSMKEQIDLSTPAGKLIFHMFGAINEFERACIKERQAEGIAVEKAKREAEGKPMWGVKKQYGLDEDLCDRVFTSYYLGKVRAVDAAEELGMKYITFHKRYHKWAEENGYELVDQRGKRGKVQE